MRKCFLAAMFLGLLLSGRAEGINSAEIYKSARMGTVFALKELFDQGVEVNRRDDRGETLLMQSAIYGGVDAVKFLLERGADVNATNAAGATALMRAAASAEKVQVLLAHGAKVNARSRIGNAPLILAARARGSAKPVQLLLDAGAEVNATNVFGASALMAAAASGEMETVRLLVSRGADVNAHSRGSQDVAIWGGGRSALGWAAFRGDRALAEFLLESGGEVNSPEGFGSALSQAAWKDNVEMARFLLERGADVRQADLANGFTPLHWAAYSERGNAALTQLLLKHGADPNAEGGEPVNAFMGIPQTPMLIAKKRGETEIVRTLRAAGAREEKAKERPEMKSPREETQVTPETLRRALMDAIPPLLETARFSKGAFLRHSSKQDCVSCHQQYLPLAAFAYAKRAGAPVDQSAEAEVLEMVRKDNTNLYELTAQAAFHPEPAQAYGYALFALGAQKEIASPETDAMVHHLLVIQGKDGQWHNNLPRPPMQSSDIAATALAINAVSRYGLPGRQKEIEGRMERARQWLAEAKPVTNEERAYQLIGLAWANERPENLRKIAAGLVQEQRPDGGWAQLKGIESDAYATGLSLFALFQAGTVVEQESARRGLAFLLNAQADDGTWRVRTRAFPFQPTMRSGFPYSRDSWISATGSSWAAIAIASALEQFPPRPSSVQVSAR